MNITQRQFKLTVPILDGESNREHRWRVADLNRDQPVSKKPDAGEKYARLLKLQAGRVMADITECPALALPAHLARLDDLREVIDFAVQHDFIPANEKHLSGKQLLFAATVADFLACMEITRKEHRAPAFINSRDESLEKIWHGIELIAGMLADQKGVPVPAALTNEQGEEER